MINLEIMHFVESEILPRYNTFDRAHNISHATRVIRSATELARQVGADEDMAYVIAAYHDLGLEGPRAIHHLTSGKILLGDARLKRWFTAEQIKIMKEAVEDHRASASHAPRSIYGRIVAEADRELFPETVIRRTIEYGLDHYPEKDREEHYQRTLEHLEEKYSQRGYIHLWVAGSKNEEYLKQLRDIIANPTILREFFERLYDEEKNGYTK